MQAGRIEEAVPVLLGLADEFAADGFVAKAVAILKRVDRVQPGRADIAERLEKLVHQQKRVANLPLPSPRPSATPEFGMEELGEGSLAAPTGFDEAVELPSEAPPSAVPAAEIDVDPADLVEASVEPTVEPNAEPMPEEIPASRWIPSSRPRRSRRRRTNRGSPSPPANRSIPHPSQRTRHHPSRWSLRTWRPISSPARRRRWLPPTRPRRPSTRRARTRPPPAREWGAGFAVPFGGSSPPSRARKKARCPPSPSPSTAARRGPLPKAERASRCRAKLHRANHSRRRLPRPRPPVKPLPPPSSRSPSRPRSSRSSRPRPSSPATTRSCRCSRPPVKTPCRRTPSGRSCSTSWRTSFTGRLRPRPPRPWTARARSTSRAAWSPRACSRTSPTRSCSPSCAGCACTPTRRATSSSRKASRGRACSR